MYPHPFVYRRAKSLAEAEKIFGDHENASFLSGGHTLIPTMKSRLAKPDVLIDLRGISELHGVSRGVGRIDVGAASTHRIVSTSPEIADAIPALAVLAGSIADPQVRNVGTIGGSVANNDPAADYPCAVLGLGAQIVTSRRTMEAKEYFLGLFSTALQPGEIIVRFSFPVPDSAGYGKLRSQASRYATAGSFVSRTQGTVRVAVTGSGSDGVFRWREAELALSKEFSPNVFRDLKPDSSSMLSDLHCDAEYRASVVAKVTQWAVENMGGGYVR